MLKSGISRVTVLVGFLLTFVMMGSSAQAATVLTAGSSSSPTVGSGLLTGAEKASLVGAPAGTTLNLSCSSGSSTTTCRWWPKGHSYRAGFYRIEKGTAGLNAYRSLLRVYPSHLAGAPAGSRWFFQMGPIGYVYDHGLIEVGGFQGLSASKVDGPLWHLYYDAFPSGCSFLNAAMMAALVSAPVGTSSKSMHPVSNRNPFQGHAAAGCTWHHGSRVGILVLDIDKMAGADHAKYAAYAEFLQSGPTMPTRATVVDQLLGGAMTAQWFDHGVFLLLHGPNGVHPTAVQAQILSKGLRMVGSRL